jgi:hypothetical protein
MIYFKLTSTFNLPNGNQSTLTITLQCLDADYQATLDEAIIVARVTAKRMCANVEPAMTNNVVTLTLAQYNALVKTPEAIDVDIPLLEEELLQTPEAEIPPNEI